MSIKKLSLAAAITVSLMTTGVSLAKCPKPCDPCNPCKPCDPCKSSAVRQPSSYGAGAAGTYKSYGTLKPWGGNAAGSTEISTFQSPVDKPTGAAASMAAKGNYGSCTLCPQGSSVTGGAAAVSSSGTASSPSLGTATAPSSGAPTISIEKEAASPSSSAPVATPSTSNYTGGAASAEREGMKCVDIPEKIPVTTGGATPVCPVAPVVPGASAGTRGGDAPPGFRDQDNPGAIAPYQETGGAASASPKKPVCPEKPVCPTPCPSSTGGASEIVPPCPPASTCGEPEMMPACPPASTGGASEITPACPTMPSSPITPACPSSSSYSKMVAPVTTSTIPTLPQQTVPANPMLQSATTCPALNQPSTGIPTGGAAAIPQQPCLQASPCPAPACPPQTFAPACVKPACTSSIIQMPTMPIAASQPWQVTGGASSLTSQITATCPNSSTNAQYLERQVYAYPSKPGIRNTVIPTGSNEIGFSSGCGTSVTNPLNIPAQNNAVSFGGYQGYPTGAAASIGCGCATPINAMPGATVTKVLRSEQSAPVTISTMSGLTLQRYALVPGCAPTGAAAPLACQFSDMSTNFWAGNSINRLASAGIISGYPDRTFKPNLPVSRAEFATILVQGLNMQNTSTFNQQIFKDVPTNYWAKGSIDKSYNQGLIAGYPNDTFRPSSSISRAEALTTLAKVVPASSTQMSAVNADQILSQYQDGSQVPTWAKIPVAQALKSGALQNSQNPNMINPNATATRADVASMIANMRQTLALEPQQPAGGVTGAAATLQQQAITVPAMTVKFRDDVSARTSNLGDKFRATTLEPVAINNVVYPVGSEVRGKIAEIVRPGNGQDGALKLAFTDITAPNGDSAALPRDVITAQVQKTGGKSLLTRAVEFPFVWPGRMVGTVGRATGGMVVTAGNASEQILGEGGAALGQVVAGNFSAAGKNGIQSAVGLGQGVFGIVMTALNGGAGLLNLTSDELGYLVTANGSRIARIVPKDEVSIAFGCLE